MLNDCVSAVEASSEKPLLRYVMIYVTIYLIYPSDAGDGGTELF